MKLLSNILKIQFILLFFWANLVFCQKDEVGTTAASFLKFGVGARAAGMGFSSYALAEDATVLYWNPAALGYLQNTSLSLNYTHLYADMKHSFLGLALPSGKGGTLGLGMLFFTSGDMTRTEAIPSGSLPFTKTGTFANYDGAIMLGYGVNLFQDTYLGFGLKGIFQYIGEEIGYGAAGDVGIFTKIQMVDVGLTVKNIGTKMKYSDIEQDLTMQIMLGTSVHLLDDKALISISGGSFGEGNTQFNFGGEYKYEFLAFRVGYRTGLEDMTGSLKGLTGGLGINYQGLNLDYAYNTFGDLGGVHLISLGFQIGASNKPEAVKTETPPPIKTADDQKKETETVKPEPLKTEPVKKESEKTTTPAVKKATSGKIISAGIELLNQPSAKSKAAAKVNKGEFVKIIEENEGWYLVEKIDRKQGWVQKKDLQVVE